MIATRFAHESIKFDKFTSGFVKFYALMIITLLVTLLIANLINIPFISRKLAAKKFKPIWTLFQNFMSKDVCDTEKPTLHGFNLLFVLWSSIGLVTSIFVGCALITLLVESPPIKIDTLDQLIKSDLKITARGPALVRFLKTSQSSSIKPLVKRFVEPPNYVTWQFFRYFLHRKKIAYIGLHFASLSCPRKRFNPNAFYLPENSMSNTLKTLSIAAVLPKGSVLEPYFNFA